ncbi:MAG: protease pro-enzyme activation domain-containing protein, partial [Actinocrinis sp.]
IAVGHAAVLPHGATPAAAPAGSTTLNVEIELNTSNSAKLAAFAQQVNDPKSPYYHQYLAKGQVAQYFGATSAEVDSVDAALKAAGLTPGPVSSDGLFIPVNTTVAQAQSAFGTAIAGYKVGSRTVYANTAAPKFDASIASDVANVVGLDDVGYFAPKYVSAGKTVTAAHLSAAKSNTLKSNVVRSNLAVPACQPINDSLGAGTHPLHDGTDYYTADQISKVYGLNAQLAAGNGGSGVTVAVFELESLDTAGYSDIVGCYNGTLPPLTQIPVDGGPTAAADFATGEGIESALDVENIADLAPKVSILDYEGPDGANDTQALDTYQRIASDDAAKVVSTSWGFCEQGNASSYIQSEKTIFNLMASQGQTVVAASGDSGSTDCHGEIADNPNQLAVDDPASQPSVLGVGGTTMSGLSNQPQAAWNSVQTDSNGTHYYGSGGGGVSVVETQPTFQNGVAASGYSAHCTLGASGCRQVPDVSALADPTKGYVIDEFDSRYNSTVLGIYGGTSGAAPVWAAVIALADASTACNGTPAGEVAPALYAVAATPARYSVFRDITTGNNAISAYGATSATYPTTTGYDLATGWGVPNTSGVVNAVCGKGLLSAASYYKPVGPTRILDTRRNIGGTGPVAKTGTVKLQITGQPGVDTSNVTAVVLNVTVTGNAGPGYATVYPDGGTLPTTSNLNWNPNVTVPNLVVVPVGADGKVDITNNSTTTAQFVGDLAGYFTSNASAPGISTYTTAGPVRAMDTRTGTGVAKAKVAPNQGVSLAVGGRTLGSGTGSVTVPAGITAVEMNVTVTGSADGGYLTVYPNQTAGGAATTRPIVSNLNFSTNQTIANSVIVPVGADGKVDFFNGSPGSTNVLADVAGYFTQGTSGAKYIAVGPARLLDTRNGDGAAAAGAIGVTGVKALPLLPTITAMVANLTVTAPTQG